MYVYITYILIFIIFICKYEGGGLSREGLASSKGLKGDACRDQQFSRDEFVQSDNKKGKLERRQIVQK